MIRRLFSDLRAGPLGQSPFRLLFLGRTTSFIGSAFANVALAFAVLELTGRSWARAGRAPVQWGVKRSPAASVLRSAEASGG